MIVTVMVATDLGTRNTVGPEVTEALVSFSDGVATQLFGVAALFVIMGDGYTKYRRLLAQRDDHSHA